MKLFIDDERDPPDDGCVWEIVRNSEAAMDAIFSYGGDITHISFDHDLGGDDTSRKVVLWMIDALMDGNIVLRDDLTFYVHSQNPIGAKWLNEAMQDVIRLNKELNHDFY